MTIRRFDLPLVLFFTVALVGCGGSSGRVPPDQDLELFPVTGTVTVNGKVAEGVAIGFQPADGTPGSGGFAVSGPGGKFEATSASGRPGLPAGKYHLLVTWLTTPDGKPIPRDALAADTGFVNQLPERFNTMDGTPFFMAVNAGENPPLNLDINTKAR